MGTLITGSVRMIGAEAVEAKLIAAAPRILEHNRKLIEAMLGEIKPVVIAKTPLGPGHFGYHLRDTYTTDVRSKGIRSIGVLKSARQGYWREYGTRRGERATQIAHHALNATRRFISFYYGGMASWWRI